MASTTFEKPLDNDVSAISTNLGSPSSASAVTGADAFSKINSLNSNMTNITQLTASFASDISVSSSSHVYAYKYMKMLLITGYINPNSNISSSKVIVTVSGANVLQEVFDSPNSSGGGAARLKISNSGQNVCVVTETPLTASQWYSFTFVTFLS